MIDGAILSVIHLSKVKMEVTKQATALFLNRMTFSSASNKW